MAKDAGNASDAPVREPERPLRCPKCGSERTRTVGTSTASENVSYYRCEACEYVFSLQKSPRVEPPPRCPECGSHRTRRKGGSIGVDPPLVYYRCRGCGHSFAQVRGQE
jgi:putative FmdB family regulatory protein